MTSTTPLLMHSLRLLVCTLISFTNLARAAEDSPSAPLLQIRERAMASDWAYQRLSDLTDKIGPRLSGSPQADAAVAQVAQALREAGFKVTLQPVRVPRWVRGTEQASIVEYPQQPAGVSQQLQLTTLGGSVATPQQGITAPVLVVKSFAELNARRADAKGRIVVFNRLSPYCRRHARQGRSPQSAAHGGEPRGVGL